MPPATVATGDTYALGAAPTGAWSGHPGAFARWTGAAWWYTAAQAGHMAIKTTTGEMHLRTASGTWQAVYMSPDALTSLAASAAAVTTKASEVAINTGTVLTKAAEVSSNAATVASATSTVTTLADEVATNAASVAATAADISDNTTTASSAASTATTKASEAASSAVSAQNSATLSAGLSYLVSIYHSGGVKLGTYYSARCAVAAGLHGFAAAEIVAGTAGSTVTFYIAIGGIAVTPAMTVTAGALLMQAGLNIAVQQGDRVDFVVVGVTGSVTEFVAQLTKTGG